MWYNGSMDGTTKMRDVPMLDSDREAMRREFGEHRFDNMTLDQFRSWAKERVQSLDDIVALLQEHSD